MSQKKKKKASVVRDLFKAMQMSTANNSPCGEIRPRSSILATLVEDIVNLSCCFECDPFVLIVKIETLSMIEF